MERDNSSFGPRGLDYDGTSEPGTPHTIDALLPRNSTKFISRVCIRAHRRRQSTMTTHAIVPLGYIRIELNRYHAQGRRKHLLLTVIHLKSSLSMLEPLSTQSNMNR